MMFLCPAQTFFYKSTDENSHIQSCYYIRAMSGYFFSDFSRPQCAHLISTYSILHPVGPLLPDPFFKKDCSAPELIFKNLVRSGSQPEVISQKAVPRLNKAVPRLPLRK